MSYSESYARELKELHKGKTFGAKKHIPDDVKACIEKYQIKSILDFGCGKGFVLEELKKEYPSLQVYGYDPAKEEYSILPDSVDMIISTDVLEHIEPELLNQTLGELLLRCNKIMYHLIACHPAKKILSDGRNAHLIIEDSAWWKRTIEQNIPWNIIKEYEIENLATLKKGDPILQKKYVVILEK